MLTAMITQWGSIVPALFDRLYREYCRARLAEMQKQLLLRPFGHEVQDEANRNANRPGDTSDQVDDQSDS
jgi:hypothetical protein